MKIPENGQLVVIRLPNYSQFPLKDADWTVEMVRAVFFGDPNSIIQTFARFEVEEATDLQAILLRDVMYPSHLAPAIATVVL